MCCSREWTPWRVSKRCSGGHRTGTGIDNRLVKRIGSVGYPRKTKKTVLGEAKPGIAQTSKETLESYEVQVIAEARLRGYGAYFITVYLAPDCLMKAVRVFLIFQLTSTRRDFAS